MKVRIRFSKTGALVYIGHLDIMRYFQKLFRRCNLPVAYSEGFSPHQILSFSHPLPLGMESVGEYADVEFTDLVTTKDALNVLKKNTVPEIDILSFRQLPDRTLNAMASVCAARYEISFSKLNIDDLTSFVSDFLAKEEILVLKKTKKSEKEENIRPFIYEIKVNGDKEIEMLLSSGSTNNLKPELVLKAMGDFYQDIPKIKRLDQYTMADNNLISLDDCGTDIIDG